MNEKTKKDISSKFIYKKGLNYFGSEGKERGPEFRSITLNIDATDIPGKKGVEGEYQDFESFRESQNIEGTIELLPLPEIKGLSDYIPVIRKKEGKLWIPNGGVFDGVDYTTVVNALDSDNSEGFNGKKYVDGIIQPNAMKIDNTVIPLGRISPAMERKSEYNKALKWVVVYGDYFMENNGRNCLIVKGEEQNGLVEVKNIMFGIRQTISAGQGQYDY